MFPRFLLLAFLVYAFSSFLLSCGQIGMISGGPRDSLPPVLTDVQPEYKATNITRPDFVFVFDEYIEVKDAFTEVLVSPYQIKSPRINFNRKTMTVRLRDSLKPNTTYTIQFGKALRDINEGNILANFSYVFSTGDHIDSFQISGRVVMAESGKADSTLFALLYADGSDTVVVERTPDYMSRVDGAGFFTFQNLPPGRYRVFALKDRDGSRTYNSPQETIAFNEVPVVAASDSTALFEMFAFQQEADFVPPTILPPAKVFNAGISLDGGLQDITAPLTVTFSRNVANPGEINFQLFDTISGQPLSEPVWDSAFSKVTYNLEWKPGMPYRLITDSTLKDTLGNALVADTIRFTAKRNEDYGRVTLHFPGIDLANNPVLRFYSGNNLAFSYPLTGPDWYNPLFRPGEYELQILFDTNRNGAWDPGNLRARLQPEKVISLPGKLQVRADWDNEQTILPD